MVTIFDIPAFEDSLELGRVKFTITYKINATKE